MPADAGQDPIRFHRLSDAYGAFTNFARFPMLLDGQWWPSTEHYFQAAKFAGHLLADQIRQAGTPAQARRLGRSTTTPLRPDWDDQRETVMRRATNAKFVQHPGLAGMLLATGSRSLIEDTPGDTFWGDGGDGSGRNLNGVILTSVRHHLRHDQRHTAPIEATHRDSVWFGDDLIVLPSSRRHTQHTHQAWDLLHHLAATATPPASVTTGTARWDCQPGTLLLRLHGAVPPADSTTLKNLLAGAEISHVHQRHVRALRPRS